MKKKILAIALAVTLLAVAGYQTLAYFTAADSVTNTITADTLDIFINEYQLANSGEVPVSSGPSGDGITVEDVVPGDTVSKIVKVKNPEGSAEAWIRVKVVTSMVIGGGASEVTDPTILAYNTADWTLQGEWYFYNTKVSGGVETSALFTGVNFPITMGNEFQGAEFTIMIEAEAVQARNNGTSAITALGWPS